MSRPARPSLFGTNGNGKHADEVRRRSVGRSGRLPTIDGTAHDLTVVA